MTRAQGAKPCSERVLITWVWVALGTHGDERVRARREERAHRRYDGHALATLPVTQDARARVAHGAKRALVAQRPGDREPSEDPVTNGVDWTRCVSRLRVRRPPFHSAMASPLRCETTVGARSVVHETQPSSSPPRHLHAALVRRPSCVDRFRKRRGGRHRLLGQRRPLRRAVTRATSPSCRARCHFAHRVGRRSLRTLSVVARSAPSIASLRAI
jgi:hypothetical protein